MFALFYGVKKHFGWQFSLVYSEKEHCVNNLVNMVIVNECHPRIKGWERDISYTNPEDTIMYDYVNIGLLAWLFYGALLTVRNIRMA